VIVLKEEEKMFFKSMPIIILFISLQSLVLKLQFADLFPTLKAEGSNPQGV